MKIYSIPHIWPPLSGIMMILCSAFFGYIFFDSILINKPFPLGLFIVLGLFTTLGVWTFILGVYYIKLISISSDNLSILFPLRLKKYKFKLSELQTHKTYNNFGRFVNYETLHFQTSDMKIFMIMQYEFWNYKKVKELIIKNSTIGEISNYHNLKTVLLLLAISLFLTFGIAGLIEIIN